MKKQHCETCGKPIGRQFCDQDCEALYDVSKVSLADRRTDAAYLTLGAYEISTRVEGRRCGRRAVYDQIGSVVWAVGKTPCPSCESLATYTRTMNRGKTLYYCRCRVCQTKFTAGREAPEVDQTVMQEARNPTPPPPKDPRLKRKRLIKQTISVVFQEQINLLDAV